MGGKKMYGKKQGDMRTQKVLQPMTGCLVGCHSD